MSKFVRDLFVASKTEALKGLKITLCGGGGIAAIELPKVARELRRNGAQVRFFVTENCLRFVGKESLEWASEQPVIINPSGFAEHICHDDAVIVMPATADLLGKFAQGICSDGVTTLFQSALGHKVPVLICPTMHESLTNSPIVQENRTKLKNTPGVFFIAPRMEEGKEKAPTPENLALEACHIINANRNFQFESRPNMLITYGGTRVSIDGVRCLTNLSTGSLGKEIIKTAYRQGIRVTGLEGNTSESLQSLTYLKVSKVPEYGDMLASLQQIDPKDFDAVFHIAAVSDFKPQTEETEKIDSRKNHVNLVLVPTTKFIELENLTKIPFRAACKLTTGTEESGLEISRKFKDTKKIHALLWNHAKVLENQEHVGVILADIGTQSEPIHVKSKEEIASTLVELFLTQRNTPHQ